MIQGYENLFKKNINNEKITMINIDNMNEFKNHPYKVLDNEDMKNLVESIKSKGVITPIIVRPVDEGEEYEIISGHRRTMASKIAGLKTIPAVIKEMTDDEAAIAMVDSNLARETILPSERAFAYKIKSEAMKHQGVLGLNTNEEIGKDMNDSGRQVARYIRLTNLVPELLELVDEGKIKLVPAVDLSYLDNKSQKILYQYIDDNEIFPNTKEAKELKNRFNADGTITNEILIDLLNRNKKSKKVSDDGYTEVKISNEIIKMWFADFTETELKNKFNSIILEYCNNERKIQI